MAFIQLQTLGAAGTGNIAQLDATYPQAVFTIRPTQNITVSKLQFAVSRASSSTTPFVRAFIRPNAGNATYKSAPTTGTPLAITSGDANGWFSAANFSTSAPTSSFSIAPNMQDFPFQSAVTLQANTDYTIHIEFDVKGNGSNQLKLYGSTASSASGNSWKVLANNLFSVDNTNYSNLFYYPFISVAGTTSTSLVENGILSYSSDYRSLGNYSNNTYLHSTFTAGQSVTLNQISAQLSWYNDLYGSASSYGGYGPSFNVTIFAASTTYPYRPTGQALASSDYIYLKNNVVYNSQTNADYGNLFAIPLTGSVTLQASTKYAIVFRLSGNDQRDNLRIFSGGSMLLESFIGTNTATSSSTGTWSPYYEYRSVYQAMTNITLSTASIAENTASGVTIGSFSTTNGTSPYTYAFSGGLADNAAFSISGNNLVTSSALDFETKSSYSIQVSATDAASNTYAKAFTVSVTNVNDAPTDISLSLASIAENNAINAVIGTLSTTDPDAGNTFTYSLSGTDAASFNISGNSLRAFQVFNYEAKNSYSINIISTDQNGLTYTKAFTISVTNANDAPTDISLSLASIAENNAIDAVVGTLSTTDPDAGNTFTYSLSGTDATSFNISGNSLRASVVFNYEAKNSYSINIISTDQNGLTYTKAFTISVTNVNEAPTNISLSLASIAENNAIDAVVGTLSTTDPDAGDTFTYSIPAGLGDDKFNISGNSLRASVVFDYETATSHSVTIRATDASGEFYSKSFTISVTNDLSDDHLSLDSSSASELPEGTIFAIISQNPSIKEVRFNNLQLPVGSVIRNSVTGQKFYKIDGGAKVFYAIPIVAAPRWGLPPEAEEAWDVLQSY